MKILYGYRYGILGGVCTQLINRLAVFTGATDIEAHLVFGEDHGISRTLDGFSNLHFEKSPNRVRDLVRRLGIDVAVVIDTPEYLDAISTLDGFPVITEVHSTLDQGLQYLHERTWPTVGYIVPSAYLKELLEDRFGIGATDAVEICPNSIDPDLFPRTQVDPIPASSVFCWVGKLDSHKNWRGFVEIAGILKDRVPGSEFWMIGGETGLATEERDMLQEVHRVGLMERFRWFPRVEYRSMHRVYAAVRQSGGAQIVTSRDESFGMSVLEALLCGCPVVAPRVGALPEIAPGKVYLSFYEPGDCSAAALLASQIADREVGAEIRDALRSDRIILERRYHRENLVPRYLESVQRLAGRVRTAHSRHARTCAPNATVPPRLREAVDQLRPYVPGLTPSMTEPEDVLAQLRKALDLRSFRVARVIAGRERGITSWMNLPSRILRSLRAGRGK
jgi:glycosyltransferase involved in cell wall biosynthesis